MLYATISDQCVHKAITCLSHGIYVFLSGHFLYPNGFFDVLPSGVSTIKVLLCTLEELEYHSGMSLVVVANFLYSNQ